jgi:Mut7-C RNAse domain
VGGKIEQGFRRRFRGVLALVRPRRLDFGVELLVGRAREAAARRGIPLARAFAEVYEFTRIRVERRLRLTGACSLVAPTWDRFREAPPRFLCDARLGGLARRLNASGYEALSLALAPGALRERARALGAVLLTSDSAPLDVEDVAEPELTVLWIPVGLTLREQQSMTLRDLGLAPREPASA